MRLKELDISDRGIFEKFLGLEQHRLSVYHFSNIFIWKRLFKIFYTVIDGCLCVFFKDNCGCFMYLPVLGKRKDPGLLKDCFAIMDKLNTNKDISRIENVECQDLPIYQKQSYKYSTKTADYVCKRDDLVLLQGSRFKSKRNLRNYFVKNYDFDFRPFTTKDTGPCLDLYRRWAQNRRRKFSDRVYQGMLEDSFLCQKQALAHFKDLGLLGYVLKTGDNIAGYTFGFSLSSEIFCVLFEICDLSYKGAPQFIFSEFCRKIPGYKYINIMDDSGLQNLQAVKLSFHPDELIANFVIRRN